MKKLFLSLIFMLFSAAIFAQAKSLVVQNQTQCIQYYIVFGDELCKCGDTYYSNLIAINPGATHTYMSSTILGGSFPSFADKSIVGARIPNGPMVCSPSGGVVGEPGCGLPSSYMFVALTPNCAPCANTFARWLPASNCESYARLVFV